jgi:hyaluronoglucosaminidase
VHPSALSDDAFVVNPLLQPEATKIPLYTYAEYAKDPLHYQPWAAWRRALLEVAGPKSAPALERFCENSLFSCMNEEAAPILSKLVREVRASLERGERVSTSEPVAKLRTYLDELDDACYHLKFRMENVALRRDLLPWIENLENHL